MIKDHRFVGTRTQARPCRLMATSTLLGLVLLLSAVSSGCDPQLDVPESTTDTSAGENEWIIGYIYKLRLDDTAEGPLETFGEAKVMVQVSLDRRDPYSIPYPNFLAEDFRAGEDFLYESPGATSWPTLNLDENTRPWGIPFLAIKLNGDSVPQEVGLVIQAQELDASDRVDEAATLLEAGGKAAMEGGGLSGNPWVAGAGAFSGAIGHAIDEGQLPEYIGCVTRAFAWSDIIELTRRATRIETVGDLECSPRPMEVGYVFRKVTAPCNAHVTVRLDAFSIQATSNDEPWPWDESEYYAHVKVWADPIQLTSGPVFNLARCPSTGWHEAHQWNEISCGNGGPIVYDGPLGPFLALEINLWDSDGLSASETRDDDLAGNYAGLWLTERLLEVGESRIQYTNVSRSNDALGFIDFSIDVTNPSGVRYRYSRTPRRVCLDDEVEYCMTADNRCPEDDIVVSEVSFSVDSTDIESQTLRVRAGGEANACFPNTFATPGDHTIGIGGLENLEIQVFDGAMRIDTSQNAFFGDDIAVCERREQEVWLELFAYLAVGEPIDTEDLGFSVVNAEGVTGARIEAVASSRFGEPNARPALVEAGAGDRMRIELPPGGTHELWLGLFGGVAGPDIQETTQARVRAFGSSGETLAEETADVPYASEGATIGLRSCLGPMAAVEIEFENVGPGGERRVHEGPWFVGSASYCRAESDE